jgi:hypothetical protein
VVAAAVEDGANPGITRVVRADRAAAGEIDGGGGAGTQASRHHVRGLAGRNGVRPAALAAAGCAGGDLVAGPALRYRLGEFRSRAGERGLPAWPIERRQWSSAARLRNQNCAGRQDNRPKGARTER